MQRFLPIDPLQMSRTLDVFVSSKDFLDDERLIVQEAIRSLGMNPILSQTSYWIA